MDSSDWRRRCSNPHSGASGDCVHLTGEWPVDARLHEFGPSWYVIHRSIHAFKYMQLSCRSEEPWEVSQSLKSGTEGYFSRGRLTGAASPSSRLAEGRSGGRTRARHQP